MKLVHHAVVAGIAALTFGCSQTAAEPRVASAGCASLPEDGLVDNFYAPGSVYAAEPIKQRMFHARALQPTRTVGAKLYVRAQPGVTQEYMERRLSCHAATGVAVHGNDPLHPSRGSVADVDVKSAGGGFAVHVVGSDSEAGREIWNRARSMSSGAGSVSVEQVSSTTSSSETM